jgi:hypothetical protein
VLCVTAVLRLKLVSLSTPQRVVLHCVRLHIFVRKPAPPTVVHAPSPADSAGLPPQLRAMLSSLGVGSGASSRPAAGPGAARKVIAADNAEREMQRLVDARVAAMEARLEARMDKLCADVEQRLRKLEQAVMGS